MSLPSTGIMASRGCPYKCRYCSKGVWGDLVRFRTVENVLAEIEHCINSYGIHDFRFFDDNLTLPQWDLKRFCSLLLERDLKITWNCYSRVNNVNRETLHLMKEAGCYHIKYGIEFGTKKALELSSKGTTLDQARRAVSLTKQVGIECKGNFILGIPGEELPHVMYSLLDAEAYTNKRILVVGGGDSAVEAALGLARVLEVAKVGLGGLGLLALGADRLQRALEFDAGAAGEDLQHR